MPTGQTASKKKKISEEIQKDGIDELQQDGSKDDVEVQKKPAAAIKVGGEPSKKDNARDKLSL